MGASSSKRVAVRVLSACQQVGEDDEIVGILLHDETVSSRLNIPVQRINSSSFNKNLSD